MFFFPLLFFEMRNAKQGPAVKRRDGVGSGFCQYCQKQVSSLRNHQARRACLKNVVLGNRGDNKEILEERFRPRDEKGKARMPSISNVDVARVVRGERL
jgi:hypothetical protein